MSIIKFKPWVGERYKKRDLFGLKILLLGESHYVVSDKEKEDFTIEVVKRLGQDERYRFFTITAMFLLGKKAGERISNEERKAFWERVAFYNYVQDLVDKCPRKRPTAQMWHDAKKPFLTVCEELKPELIVVLGKELCWNLPDIPSKYTYCCVRHPSAGFSYKIETPKLLEAVNKAKIALVD